MNWDRVEGNWKIVHQRFGRWARSGIFDRLFKSLASDPDNEYMMIDAIPLRLENPKIGRVDDAEIVGNRIAEDGPVFRHLHAQEMQNGSAEVVVARVASVVGHVTMHQPP